MTLSLPYQHFLHVLRAVGFGRRTQSGFPGESSGYLPYRAVWQPFDIATLGFGYGIAVTPLQLAHAYTVMANHGKLCPVTFIKRDKPVFCPQVIKRKIADEMLTMLESVVQPGGTGTRAVIPGYRVAGKTGTAYIADRGGYNHHEHMASFVGIAPVSNPRLVVAVVVKNPHRGWSFGGVVAAPAFAKIMAGALRILNVPPDKGLIAKPVKEYAPFLTNLKKK
jgi:cell division protein FtsI (penicillin-binding protein 3)